MLKFRLIAGVLVLFVASCAFAQKDEIAVLGGTTFTSSRGFFNPVTCLPGVSCNSGALSFGHNFTVEGAYAHRIFNGHLFNVKIEAPFVGGNSISVASNNPSAASPPKDYSALYFTPGLRVTAIPFAGISPWVSAGGGLARFGPNGKLLNGTVNPSSNANTTSAFQFGGGLDFKILPFVAVRGEVRDFYTSLPNLDEITFGGRSHNVIVSGGLVFHF